MSNQKPKRPDNFPAQQAKWKSGKTTTIRVPIALKERIEAIARQLDEELSQDERSQSAN